MMGTQSLVRSTPFLEKKSTQEKYPKREKHLGGSQWNSVSLCRCENMTVTGKGQIYSFSVNKQDAFNEGMYYVFPKKAKKYIENQKRKHNY